MKSTTLETEQRLSKAFSIAEALFKAGRAIEAQCDDIVGKFFVRCMLHLCDKKTGVEIHDDVFDTFPEIEGAFMQEAEANVQGPVDGGRWSSSSLKRKADPDHGGGAALHGASAKRQRTLRQMFP